MAGLTKEQRAQRAKEQLALEAKRLEIMQKIAKGEISPEDGLKLLNPVNEVREIKVLRVEKDGAKTNKVKITGLYSRYPVTLYAEHIVRLQDEGHWDKVVALAREIVAEGGESLDVDAPPADEAPSAEGAAA